MPSPSVYMCTCSCDTQVIHSLFTEYTCIYIYNPFKGTMLRCASGVSVCANCHMVCVSCSVSVLPLLTGYWKARHEQSSHDGRWLAGYVLTLILMLVGNIPLGPPLFMPLSLSHKVDVQAFKTSSQCLLCDAVS